MPTPDEVLVRLLFIKYDFHGIIINIVGQHSTDEKPD